MKRILFVLMMLVSTVGVSFAQSQASAQFEPLRKKINKSSEEIVHPKKSLNPNTWLKRAGLLVELQTAYQMNSYTGVDLNTMQLLAGPPTGQREETVEGQPYLVYETPHVDFFFLDGALAFYRVSKPVVMEPSVENPLVVALEAYNKAIEVDEKGKRAKNIAAGLVQLKNLFINEGVNEFSQSNFKGAVFNFDKALAISDMTQVQTVDTAIYYYHGIASFQAKDYEAAVKSFGKALSYGYELDGTTYCVYYEACAAADRPKDGKEMLLTGIEKYPEQQCLVLDLINYYISQNEDPALVLPYIEKALQKDPENEVLYFVEGVVYDQLGRSEDALASYDRAVEKNPEFVDAYYNKAALYYNQGVAYLNEAIEIPANKVKEYDAMMEKVNDAFHKSIVPAEKVLTINPEHVESLDLLKTVYFRYRAEPAMQEKHDEVAKKLQELGR